LNEQNKKKIKPKPFLKRKTRKIKFQKLNWNKVKSKTDCWTKRSGRSEHREKSHQKLSRNKSQKKVSHKNENEITKPRMKNKIFNNIKSRIDTGIRKNQSKFESNHSGSFELPHQYNIGGYCDENNDSVDNQRDRLRNESNYPLEINVKRFQLNNQNYRNEPDVQYEVFSSNEEVPHTQEYEHSEVHPQFGNHQDVDEEMEIYGQIPKETRKYQKNNGKN